jgi:HPt (histidine-containing phosphotransfer) domain-containing protein
VTITHLDPGVLAALKDIMGEDYPMLIDTYLKDSDQRLVQLQGASDPRVLREAAHSFKGSSSNMGATRLAGWCGQLEHLALDAPSEQVAGLLEAITQEFTAVRAAFMRERSLARQ